MTAISEASTLSFPSDDALIAISRDGFVDGASFTNSDPSWIVEMGKAGFGVLKVNRLLAKQVLFSTIEVEDSEPTSETTSYGRMIVARNESGEVVAAAWDCGESRKSAREWVDRGLSIELVAAEHVHRLAKLCSGHVFSSITPVGDVLSAAQAKAAFASF